MCVKYCQHNRMQQLIQTQLLFCKLRTDCWILHYLKALSNIENNNRIVQTSYSKTIPRFITPTTNTTADNRSIIMF